MLPRELLRIRIRKGVARPAYISSEEDWQALRDVLEAFSGSAGLSLKYSELEERISDLSQVYDHRLVRGLARLLRRRLALSRTQKFDPEEVRGLLFSMGPVLSREERSELVRSIAGRLGVSPEELEDGLFSDVERGRTITGFAEISPEDLASWYNAELAETLIARSSRLIVRSSEHWSSILRRIKGLGLMYEVAGEGVEVTGPASVLKAYERYGRAAAGLVPLLSGFKWWRAEGELLTGSGRRLPFVVDSSEAEMRYPRDLISQEVRPFDSEVEERFYRALRQAAPDLQVRREPAVLRTAGGVMVPDFSVESGGRRVYVEVVGFWTSDYLRRKVEKLRGSGEDVIVVADRSLGASGLAEGIEGVIFYDSAGSLPIKELVEAIRRRLGPAPPRAEGPPAQPSANPELERILEELVGLPMEEVEPKLAAVLGDSWLKRVEELGYGFEWRTLDARGLRLVRRRPERRQG